MSKAHEVVQKLMDAVPISELSSDENRSTFERIKHRLQSAPDLQAELRSLYTVEGFSDFALSLMWIAQQAESDASATLPSPADTTLVFSSFRRAVGEAAMAEDQPQPAAGAAEATAGGGSETFSVLLERFVEAIQSGEEQRSTLLERVVNECEAVGAGDFPEDFRLFSTLLAEFLRYVLENQLLDDIRVLNILANIPSPVAHWVSAAPEARAGLFEEEINILRDFKSHFE
ncbi:MAG: hypothetical protein FJ217_14570 [Ignavibacteria bacterium]|nr:hypothetical protein [Ignavibacteria bacterium]